MRRRPSGSCRGEVARLLVEVDGNGTVRLSGELHEEDASVFRSAMASPTMLRPRRIDLARVTSTDATGVQLLVSLRQDERRRGGTLELLNVPPSLAQVLCIAELADQFDAVAATCRADHTSGSQNATFQDACRSGGR